MIDLMPDSIRARSEAAVVAGRYVAASLIALLLVLVPTAHSQLMLEAARQSRSRAEEQANKVLDMEQKARALSEDIRGIDQRIARYEMVAHPLPISRLVATIVNDLPAGATIDRLVISAGRRVAVRSARIRPHGDDARPLSRELVGEVTGFAPRDEDVAHIVGSLEALGICEYVDQDRAKWRRIRDRNAREFRITFRIDLERHFLVEERAGSPPLPEGMVSVQ